MCWSKSSKTLSWFGVLWGLLSLAALLTAFLSNVWIYTKEPIRFPNNDILTTVTFEIGLWRICPSFKRTNTTYVQSPSCTSIKYSTWDDITANDLGISFPLEFTSSFLSKMRISTPFAAASMIIILAATVLALGGLYSSDQKTIMACGLYMLGGLTLGGGLLIFASVLSDAYFERPRKIHVINEAFGKVTSSNMFDYKYGWSFFAAGAAFFMSEMAAVLSISAYLRRFPTVEDMVRITVPGAERKLKEHQGLAGEYLVQHQSKYQRQDPDASASMTSGLSSKCKSEILTGSDLEIGNSILLSKPAPDICVSNPAVITEDVISFTHSPSVSSDIIVPRDKGFCLKSELPYTSDESNDAPTDSILANSSLAGQTVPIVLMNHPQKPLEPSFMFTSPAIESKKNFKTSVSIVEGKRNFGFNTAVLSSRHYFNNNQCQMSTLDTNVLQKQFIDFEDHLNESQNFGLDFTQINPEVESNVSSFFQTFHGEGNLLQSNTLRPIPDSAGTCSTTSSSSAGTGTGTGNETSTTIGSSNSSTLRQNLSEKKKKKSVTIGNVFSTMNTFESDKRGKNFFNA